MVSKMSHIAIGCGRGNSKLHLENYVAERWLMDF